MLALGIWLLLFATNPGRNETVDVEIRRVVARQLWSSGTVAVSSQLDGYAAWVETSPGRWVAPYGIGQSLLLIPFDMAGAALEHIAPAPVPKNPGAASGPTVSAETWRERLAWLPIGLGMLPLLGVAYWFALRGLLVEWGFDRPWPTFGASTLLLGTIAFHYAGQGQEETLIGFLLTLAMTFALRARRASSSTNAALSGLFAGACILTRPVSVFALLIVPATLLTQEKSWRERSLSLVAAGASAAAATFLSLLYNYARFGNLFTFGYDRLGHFSKIALDARSPEIFLSLLAGPGVGLLVLSPALLVAVYGFVRLWTTHRGFVVGALVAILSCYTFFSAWHDSYTGGVAWGTRYQCHLLPLFVVPLTAGMQALARQVSTRRLLTALLAWSVTIQALSVVATHHIECGQAICDRMDDASFRNGLSSGQLGRRIENVARWAVGAGPPPVRDTSCDATIATMWDRYIPNFWGPVIAHRLSHGGQLLVSTWALLLGAALTLVGCGIRGEVALLGGDSPDASTSLGPPERPGGSEPADI